jgi:hypothetical protein
LLFFSLIQFLFIFPYLSKCILRQFRKPAVFIPELPGAILWFLRQILRFYLFHAFPRLLRRRGTHALSKSNSIISEIFCGTGFPSCPRSRFVSGNRQAGKPARHITGQLHRLCLTGPYEMTKHFFVKRLPKNSSGLSGMFEQPIEHKTAREKKLFSHHGDALGRDTEVLELLNQYREAIRHSAETMRQLVAAAFCICCAGSSHLSFA